MAALKVSETSRVAVFSRFKIPGPNVG